MIIQDVGKTKAYLSYAFDVPDEELNRYLSNKGNDDQFALLTDELEILSPGDVSKHYESWAIIRLDGDIGLEDLKDLLLGYKENYLENLINESYFGVFFTDLMNKNKPYVFDIFSEYFIKKDVYYEELLNYDLLDIYKTDHFSLTNLIKVKNKKLRRDFINELFDREYTVSDYNHKQMKLKMKLFSY